MRDPRPPDFGPEVKSSMHCPVVLVTLPGLRALQQESRAEFAVDDELEPISQTRMH
jgi:hypothetical protein